MTLIQPNKHKDLLNLIIILLSVALVGAVIGLIFVYNQTVSLTRGARSMQAEIVRLQAENSELKTATFALLEPDRLSDMAAARGMNTSVPTWVAASHF
jgi:cell division protein FtsL